MLTIICGIVVGTALAMLAAVWLGWGWTVFIGVAGFVAASVLLNLRLKKRMEAVFNDVQQHVEASQDQLRRKITRMQNKMMSGGKGLQRRMEHEQAEGIREALRKLDRVKPLQRWNLLAERQANTLRAQLHYQIKEFEKADECFRKCLIMDPLTLAMKMARQHAHSDAAALEKTFRKGVKRFKDEEGAILYALYSYILVKQGRIDDAAAVLNQGKEKTEDDTLRQNWSHLVNGRIRRFSNAGLGDRWYALHLETPKPIKIKQRMGRKTLR